MQRRLARHADQMLALLPLLGLGLREDRFSRPGCFRRDRRILDRLRVVQDVGLALDTACMLAGYLQASACRV